MKNFIYTSFLMVGVINAQNSFKNFGDIQMHNGAEVGFHVDLINDGQFENNQGFTGFYSDSGARVISGNNRAVFNNVEIDVIDDLYLETSVGISNELEFVNGKVLTPRDNVNVSLDFINHDYYVGEDDFRHTDGYTSVLGSEEFTFPIGDDNRFRPMIVPNQNSETYFNGAYFFEDPNSPTTFNTDFDTENKQIFLENISNLEFWDLDGNTETTVTLTWDADSDIESISEDLSRLTVVGWNKGQNRWFDLGGNDISGNSTSGRLTSSTFVPDDFDIITIGSVVPRGDLGDDVNILMSPNDDSTNDALVFEGLEQFKRNTLTIFNRWGNSVLEVEGYNNDWVGISEGRATVNKNEKLPAGTYFYVLNFGNDQLDRKLTGWVYISR